MHFDYEEGLYLTPDYLDEFFKVEITVDENENSNIYDIINDEEQLKDMSEAIVSLIHEDLKVGQAGFMGPSRYAIMAIMDEILYRSSFVDIYIMKMMKLISMKL